MTGRPRTVLLRNTEIQWSGLEPLLTFLMSSVIFPDIYSFDRGHVRIFVRIINTDNLKTGGRITNSIIFKIFRSDQSNDFKSFTKNDVFWELSLVSQNWDQVLKNGFLHRVPDWLRYLGQMITWSATWWQPQFQKMTPRGAKIDFNDATVKMISAAYFWPYMWLS